MPIKIDTSIPYTVHCEKGEWLITFHAYGVAYGATKTHYGTTLWAIKFPTPIEIIPNQQIRIKQKLIR